MLPEVGFIKYFSENATNNRVKLNERDSLIKKKSFTKTGVVDAREKTMAQDKSLFPPVRLKKEMIDLVR